MEKQSKQRHRTNKNKTKQERKNSEDAINIDKQTQTPKTMKDKRNKRQNQRIKQSNGASCSTTQEENNLNNTPQANTSPQDKIESCNIDHTIPSQTQTHNKNQTQVNKIDNVLPSDADYEWWI